METTVERTYNNNSSIMHYWGLVKNLDDKLKLELVSMLISSARKGFAVCLDAGPTIMAMTT